MRNKAKAFVWKTISECSTALSVLQQSADDEAGRQEENIYCRALVLCKELKKPKCGGEPLGRFGGDHGEKLYNFLRSLVFV